MYIVHCTVYIVHTTLYTALNTVHVNSLCILYTVYCTKQCKLYIVDERYQNLLDEIITSTLPFTVLTNNCFQIYYI